MESTIYIIWDKGTKRLNEMTNSETKTTQASHSPSTPPPAFKPDGMISVCHHMRLVTCTYTVYTSAQRSVTVWVCGWAEVWRNITCSAEVKTRGREEVELKGSALKGKMARSKVLLNVILQISSHVREVVGVRKKNLWVGSPLSCFCVFHKLNHTIYQAGDSLGKWWANQWSPGCTPFCQVEISPGTQRKQNKRSHY